MSDKPKKGHSVGLGKVIGITIVALFIGILVGGILCLTVVVPELQKLNINIPGISTNDQNNNSNNNNYSNNNNNNYSNNNNNNNYNNSNNNNNNSSNPTVYYDGNGDFQITVPTSNGTYSGTMTANIQCQVQQNETNIQLSLDLIPLRTTGSLQQLMSPNNSDQKFNFTGTMQSSTQFTANAQGSTGSSTDAESFNFNVSGTIDSNTLTFIMTSQPDSQITITTQQITLNSNK